jgi:hypothetical protein
MNQKNGQNGLSVANAVILLAVVGLSFAIVYVTIKFIGSAAPTPVIAPNGELKEWIETQINHSNIRIDDIWASIQAIGLISGIIGVLITVLVLYFSFSNSTQISNAIDEFEKQKSRLESETRENLSRIKKEIRESSVDFRVEIERRIAEGDKHRREIELKINQTIEQRISEQDKHQRKIEFKVNQIQENLQKEIRIITVETNIQQRQLQLKNDLIEESITSAKIRALSEINDAKNEVIKEIKSLSPGDGGAEISPALAANPNRNDSLSEGEKPNA